jgi:G6PDH family F420-dependent oxidoreductase
MAKAAIGYTLSSEEHTPQSLIDQARQAEEAGFQFLSISDHFFPWIDKQGQSPFVWAVLGGISQVTKQIPVMTGVTCPIVRIHPVNLAQAAATTAALLEDRFMFGVGTGENLNEHVVGAGWPNINTRLDMLQEAVAMIRELWKGELTDIQGAYFTVDQARIYSLPQHLPSILVSATGPESAKLAGAIGDGLVTTSPDAETLKAFEQAGGTTKPRYLQVSVCYDPDEQRANQTAAAMWPTAAISGQASQELPMPLHFEQLAESVTPEQIAQSVVCGPDVERHRQQIQQAIEAGFTHIYVHQIGPDQKSFLKFYQDEVLPHFG